MYPGSLWPVKQKREQFIRVVCFEHWLLSQRPIRVYPDAIWAQLEHLQTREVVQVGNTANFVVKQKKFLQTGQLLQPFHLPQNVEGNIKLPVIRQRSDSLLCTLFKSVTSYTHIKQHKTSNKIGLKTHSNSVRWCKFSSLRIWLS